MILRRRSKPPRWSVRKRGQASGFEFEALS
jgi:hypothetical protein